MAEEKLTENTFMTKAYQPADFDPAWADYADMFKDPTIPIQDIEIISVYGGAAQRVVYTNKIISDDLLERLKEKFLNQVTTGYNEKFDKYVFIRAELDFKDGAMSYVVWAEKDKKLVVSYINAPSEQTFIIVGTVGGQFQHIIKLMEKVKDELCE